MGLDTSHDCWHGAYTAFHRWRAELMRIAHDRDIMSMRHYGGTVPWSALGNDPLIVLLDHSDCDGIIEAKDCEPLAKRLEELLPLLPKEDDRGHIGSWQKKTQQFIDGLRLAASRGEDVDFH